MSNSDNTDRSIDNRRSFSINYRQLIRKRIPIIQWLPNYTIAKFLADLLAGFTVGLTEIPQGIAYATVAGLPTEYGLYSGFMGCFMYFIFGTTKDINIGPTAIMALMVYPHVHDLGPAMAVLICFLSGCIIFSLGLLHLGFIIEFFSYPIIAGFTSAAALNIASTQINSLLGIPKKAEDFTDAIKIFFEDFNLIRRNDAILGLMTMIFLFATKEMRRFGSLKYRSEWSRSRNIAGKIIFLFSMARNAIAVLVCSIVAFCIEGEDGSFPFKVTGKVTAGLPSFQLPPFSSNFNNQTYTFSDMISNYGSVIAFCPLIAILEHVAIAKAFTKGKTLDATQEMLALGISNIMASFVSSMPITGSFTRTAVNNSSGVKTTAGGLITGAMVLLALGFLTSAFRYIPKATLAAVVIVAMFYLFESHAFVILWKTKKLDLLAFLTTLLFCLFLSLEYGIIIGIGFNLSFVLYSNARPKLDIYREKHGLTETYLITPRTALHFTSAEYLRERILADCTVDQSIVILNGKYVGNIDATVAKTFADIIEELRIRDQKIIFWNFKKKVIDICLGLEKNFAKHFASGVSIESILLDKDEAQTILTDISSIQ